MESKIYISEPLFEKVESCTRTSFLLYKLKTIRKSADILSTLASRSLAIILFSIFIIMANIGAAIWLGDLVGNTYNGFFYVAGFYGLAGIIVYFVLHNGIKRSISNSIVSRLLD